MPAPDAFPDAQGHMAVVTVPYIPDLVTGALAAVGNTVVADVRRASTVVIALVSGTFAGLNAIFEGSLDSTDGINGSWTALSAVRSNSNTVESVTGVIAAVPAYSWRLNTSGYNWLRVRATALTSGSPTFAIQRSMDASEPVPGIGQHAITSAAATAGVTNTPVAPSAISFATTASTNGGNDKSTAGSLFEISCSNPTAATVYLKLYNKATAPTVGTDVPVLTVPVGAGATVSLDFGSLGKRFSAGIGHAVTGAMAANDTTAVAAGAQVHGSYV